MPNVIKSATTVSNGTIKRNNFLIGVNTSVQYGPTGPSGSKDETFNIGTGFDDSIYSTKIQSDGKILVGGWFTTFTGSSQNRLIRLNSDGSKDTSFDIGSGFNNDVESIAIQSDGKILVGGRFTTFTGSSQNRLIRLNSDGSKDTSFDIGSGFNSILVASIAIQSDGKILVGGSFTTFTGSSQNKLIRLNSDGSKDSTFNIGSGFNSEVNSVAIQSDGKILAGGAFTTFSGGSQNQLIRLNSDGSKDSTLDVGNGFNNRLYVIAIQSDGKILVGGSFTTFTGSSQNYFIRLNSDGSKDTSFDIGTGFNNYIESIAIQSDGKILVGGYYTTYQGLTQNYFIRLNSDGSKDTSFDIGTGFNEEVDDIAIQSDGKILAGGWFTTFAGSSQNRFIRLNTDGTGFWSGIVPPSGGYTVYAQKESQGPSIRTASNDSELITIAIQYGGTNINTANDALNFFNSQSQYMVTNIDYGNIVTSGLTLLLDSGYIPSYSRSGTTWSDLSGNNNNGTLTNGPTYNSANGGFFGFATDDYVLVPENSALNTQTPSIEMWIKTNSTNQNGMWFEKGQLNTQYNLFQEGASFYWRQRISTGVVQLSMTTSTYLSTTSWAQVVATFTSGDRKIYVNGVVAASDTQTGTIVTDTNGVSIGVWGGFTTRPADGRGYFYNGNIAIVRVYNIALTQSQILQNYNAQKSRFGL